MISTLRLPVPPYNDGMTARTHKAPADHDFMHPGEILREEFLIPLALSARALATSIHVPATRINDIVRERRGISADTALRLGKFFGTTAQFWLNLQTEYDLQVAMAAIAERGAGEEITPYARAA